MMTAMDMAKIIDVNMFELLWATRFCFKSNFMLFFSQNNRKKESNASMRALMFTANRVRPRTIPKRSASKILRIKDAFFYRRA